MPRTHDPEYQFTRKTNIRQFMRDAKDRPCTDCGVEYPYYVMDLDHVDPSTKTICPSQIPKMGWSLERVTKELAKCEVVCANCHRERSAQREDWYVRSR